MAQNNNSYSHILKYTSIFGGIQFINLLIAIVRNKFVALLLGPLGMGLVSLFNSTISLVSNTTNLGLSMSAVKTIAEKSENGTPHQLRSNITIIRSWSIITALAGMLLCIVSSPLLNSFTFTWGDHTLHFICLSPIVAFMAITGGETAILKGTGRLNSLAKVSVVNVLLALFTSVPLYYFFGSSAIMPVLILISLTQMLLTVRVSFRIFPYSISLNWSSLHRGVNMVRLGMAFVAAGIFGSGADFIIRSFLNTTSSLDTVGLYNAGYTIAMIYAGMVFTAMETDYFPRLSAANNNVKKRNIIVNRQIEISLLLLSPMLVALNIALPLVLPLLYSNRFIPIIDMTRVAIVAMYFRTIKLPIAYLPLARGESRSYLFLEMCYNIVVVVLTILSYRLWSLTGLGIALAATCTIDVLIVLVYAYHRYSYVLSRPVVRCFIMQLPLGICAMACMFISSQLVYWTVGILIVCISCLLSLLMLKGKTTLWQNIVERFHSHD